MDLIWQKFTDWLKEILIGGIKDALSGLFDALSGIAAVFVNDELWQMVCPYS